MQFKYRPYLWDGTRSPEPFTNKAKAVKWIREQMRDWMEKGDRLLSYSLKGGICFYIENSVGECTDAWATLDLPEKIQNADNI